MAKKKSQIKKFRLPIWAYLSAALLVLLLIFLVLDGVGYARRVYYGYQAREAFSNQYNSLSPALKQLGLVNAQADSKCEKTDFAAFEEKQLICAASQQNDYVPISNAEKGQFVGSAKELDEVVNSTGEGVASDNVSTFEQWVKDVSSGRDYYSDITGYISGENYACSVSMHVAYSKPDKPAYGIAMLCNSPVVDGGTMVYL